MLGLSQFASAGAYERSLPEDIYSTYKSLTVSDAREIQLDKGTFFIFGGEESYGYLACDFTRDKDGNSAVNHFIFVPYY